MRGTRRRDDLRDPAIICRVGAARCFDIVVELIDRRLAGLERVVDADRIGHVAREPHAQSPRGRDDRVISLASQSFMNLEMVEAGSLLLYDEPAADLRRGRRIAREWLAWHPQSWSQQLAAGDARFQLEMRERSLHAAHCRHTIRDIKEKDV